VGVAVGVQNALRVLRRPGGVEDERALVGGSVLCGEVLRGAFREFLEGFPALVLLPYTDEVPQARGVAAYLLGLPDAFGTGDDHGRT
jgi:hypothetical protein